MNKEDVDKLMLCDIIVSIFQMIKPRGRDAGSIGFDSGNNSESILLSEPLRFPRSYGRDKIPALPAPPERRKEM